MDNYPPGVSGNEPQITGEWPCGYCDGSSRFYQTDCPLCKGTGIQPEDAWEMSDLKKQLTDLFVKYGFGKIDFDEDDEFLAIHTNFKTYGEYTMLEED